MSKIKTLVRNYLAERLVDPSKHRCGVCKKGGGKNLIFCHYCKSWIHYRFSNIKGRLRSDSNFKCQKCCQVREITPASQLKHVKIGKDKLKVVRSFYYLGDVTSELGSCYSDQICLEKISWINPYTVQQKLTLLTVDISTTLVWDPCFSTLFETPRLPKADESMVRWICSVKIFDRYSMNKFREKLELIVSKSIQNRVA